LAAARVAPFGRTTREPAAEATTAAKARTAIVRRMVKTPLRKSLAFNVRRQG
jgi:hypothetical protein